MGAAETQEPRHLQVCVEENNHCASHHYVKPQLYLSYKGEARMLYTSLGFWAFLMQRLAPKKLLNCFDNDFHDCGIFIIFKNVSYASSLNFSQKKEIY